MSDNTAFTVVFIAFVTMCALITWARAWENVNRTRSRALRCACHSAVPGKQEQE